ncbi:MAG: hypothetical protein IKI41_09030 [Clostridia bacterium]|nr:hypothetical protein [Clostridia bacterium]
MSRDEKSVATLTVTELAFPGSAPLICELTEPFSVPFPAPSPETYPLINEHAERHTAAASKKAAALIILFTFKLLTDKAFQPPDRSTKERNSFKKEESSPPLRLQFYRAALKKCQIPARKTQSPAGKRKTLPENT